jgi:hypothetical protein
MAQSLRYKLAPKGRLQAVQYVRGLGDLLLVKRTDGAAVLSAHLVRRCAAVGEQMDLDQSFKAHHFWIIRHNHSFRKLLVRRR